MFGIAPWKRGKTREPPPEQKPAEFDAETYAAERAEAVEKRIWERRDELRARRMRGPLPETTDSDYDVLRW